MAATLRYGILGALCLCLAGGEAAAGVLPTPGGVRFSYEDANANQVSLAGSFNDWNATANPMVLEEGGVWSTVVRLGAGTHEYKFVVDSQWIADPENSVTVGDFGNSGLTLDESGQVVRMKATSNTPYSAKILMEGRTIGTYRSLKNPDNGDRFELRRPHFDTDLGFNIRVNDALEAFVLTNLSNEAENVEQFRTRLNFDRGHLDFREGDFAVRAWDNDVAADWEDPLKLVGGVGIYDHAFGFGTQGAMLERSWRGWTGRMIYTDNFEDGGQNSPLNNLLYSTITAAGSANAFGFFQTDEAGQVSLADGLERQYVFNRTSNDEDVLAGRAMKSWAGFDFGLSARLDRGYNPASFGYLSNFGETTLTIIDSVATGTPDPVTVRATTGERLVFDVGTEQWRAYGFDVETKEFGAVNLRTEILYGMSEFVGRDGRKDDFFLATVPASVSPDPRGIFSTWTGDSVITVEDLDDPEALVAEAVDFVGSGTVRLAESWRFFLGLDELPRPLGFETDASIEIQTMNFEPTSTGLTEAIFNEMFVYRLNLARNLGSRVEARLGIEAFDFHYDQSSPWDHQFWFDDRNFWLENGEHRVAYDRLVLLGDDALFWRPSIDVQLSSKPSLRLEYDGTFAASGLTREPKYTETLVKGIWQIRPRWTALADLRFVKYNDRILDLDDSYNETFLELKYAVTEGIEVALSYGVDPWAIDDPVNEYGYIGRDLFLFERGANAETARTNFLGLDDRIRAAESALANERLVQLEAIMRF